MAKLWPRKGFVKEAREPLNSKYSTKTKFNYFGTEVINYDKV